MYFYYYLCKYIDEVMNYISSKPKPSSLYIFSRNDKVIDHILNHTES